MKKDTYVLDADAVILEHATRTGTVPSVESLRALELCVEMASRTYHQGAAGDPFDVGHGIPVKRIE